VVWRGEAAAIAFSVASERCDEGAGVAGLGTVSTTTEALLAAEAAVLLARAADFAGAAAAGVADLDAATGATGTTGAAGGATDSTARLPPFAAAFFSAFSRATSFASGTFVSLDGVPAETSFTTCFAAGFEVSLTGAVDGFALLDETGALRTERRADESFAIGQ